VPATILDSVPTRRLLPLVGALLLLLSACRVDIRIDVTADNTGAGTIDVTVDIDAEAVALVPGLAGDLRLDDLIASGWLVDGPTQVNSGGLRVLLRYPFESPAEATLALRQISGVNGPLLNPELKRTVDGRTVNTTLDATLQFVGGLEAFSDPALTEAIGAAPWIATAEKLGIDPTTAVSVTLIAHLPGEIKKSTGTEAEAGVIWNSPTDGTAQVVIVGTAESTVDGGFWATLTKILGYVIIGWLVLMGLLIAIVYISRRRRGPPREPRPQTPRTRRSTNSATPDA